MVLRFIFRYLSNNEHLIQKLSESYPLRRAARIFVSFYYKGQSAIQETNLKNNLSSEKFKQFARDIAKDFKQGFQDGQNELRKKK